MDSVKLKHALMFLKEYTNEIVHEQWLLLYHFYQKKAVYLGVDWNEILLLLCEPMFGYSIDHILRHISMIPAGFISDIPDLETLIIPDNIESIEPTGITRCANLKEIIRRQTNYTLTLHNGSIRHCPRLNDISLLGRLNLKFDKEYMFTGIISLPQSSTCVIKITDYNNDFIEKIKANPDLLIYPHGPNVSIEFL